MNIYICIYIYIHTYVLYTHSNLYLLSRVPTNTTRYGDYVYVYVYVCICICICICIYVCIYIRPVEREILSANLEIGYLQT